MTYVFIALGVICLLYCAGILISGVYGSWFFLIWGITGTAFLALAWLYQKNIWLRLPGIIQKLMIAAILTGAFLFLFIEALIISKFTSKGIPDLDYLIVLGAQMRETGPSKALALRLDTAAAYLTENPDTLVVVSGGKGSNEPISEAQGMYEYLLTKGISPDRILLEDRSTNTKENLQFSRPLIPTGCHRRNCNQQLSRIPQHPPGRPTRLPPGLRPLSPLRHSHASQQHVPGILRSS